MNKFVITMLILLFGAMCYSAGNAVATLGKIFLVNLIMTLTLV